MEKKIVRSKTPLVSNVPCDEFTKMVENNFDYEFTGESEFYPYELPELGEHQIIVITGASGSGKSTLLKEFPFFNKVLPSYDNTKAIVSNFRTPQEASEKLSAVGLNSMPVWCRPRNVLSIGEGFRADLALRLDSNVVFDEFTSTIDRNVAMSTANAVQQYIRDKGLKNVVFCSCHKDYIPFLRPNVVIDLDDDTIKMYGEQGMPGKQLPYQSQNATTSLYGTHLADITI